MPAYVTTCPFNLSSLMRKHRITIRGLSKRMGVSIKRIRQVRTMSRVDYLTYCDFREAVTGEVVFSRARYDAMDRQSRCN